MSAEKEAAPRVTGQAASVTNAENSNTSSGAGVQASYVGRRYVRTVEILGARVRLDGRDEVVLDAIKRAGMWDALAPHVRNGVSVVVCFPGDRSRFAVWCGNTDDGGFLMYHVMPRDYARILAVATLAHTEQFIMPEEVTP